MNIPFTSPKYFLGALIPNVKVLSATIDAIIASFTKGAVTQLTSIATPVTLNTPTGVITTVALTTAAGAVSGPFVVNNSKVLANSVVVASVEYAFNKTGSPVVQVEAVTSGKFKLKIGNAGSVVLNDIVKIHYIVI